MHVYAPGAENYQIITFNVESDPLLVAAPLQHPAAEMYHFQPLDERVPVYQKPFRLSRKFQVASSRERQAAPEKAGKITIKGTLDYQACDDKLCFKPKSVPVSYTVQLRPSQPEGGSQ
jgi:hypothetical protein